MSSLTQGNFSSLTLTFILSQILSTLSSLFFRFVWVLVQSYPDSNWCTDPDPKSLSHLTYTLSHIWSELSSLFFRLSNMICGICVQHVMWYSSPIPQRLLRGIHRDTLINLDILSISLRNANVKSFLNFFCGRAFGRAFGMAFGILLAIAKTIPTCLVWFLQGPLRIL